MNQFFVEHWTGPATQKDLDSIKKLNLEELKQTREMTLEQFVDFLNRPDTIFVIARDTETKDIIGKQTMYLTPLDDGVMKTQLEQVATDSRYTRRGIATAIWKKLVEKTYAKGGNFEAHWTSSTSKEAAQKLYGSIPGCERRETNNFTFKYTK